MPNRIPPFPFFYKIASLMIPSILVKSIKGITLFCIVIFQIFGDIACSEGHNNDKNSLKISAAASLTGVLSEIASKFEHDSGVETQFNFASSSVLARQIANGLQTDLFISADKLWMNYLIEQNLVDRSRVIQIVSNSLLVVVPVDSRLQFSSVNDLLQGNIRTIAVGDPGHVPAGRYAQQTLEKAGIWNQIKLKLVGTVDVRAALAFAENGAADCAIVYTSDLYVSRNVKPAFNIPENLQPEIIYTGAIVSHASSETARLFMSFLQDSTSRQIYIKHGFKPI